jgi:hypothetical protein
MTEPDRTEKLRRQIEELRARFPVHSIPPALMAELDALETELAEHLTATDRSTTDHA